MDDETTYIQDWLLSLLQRTGIGRQRRPTTCHCSRAGAATAAASCSSLTTRATASKGDGLVLPTTFLLL